MTYFKEFYKKILGTEIYPSAPENQSRLDLSLREFEDNLKRAQKDVPGLIFTYLEPGVDFKWSLPHLAPHISDFYYQCLMFFSKEHIEYNIDLEQPAHIWIPLKQFR